MANQVVGAAFGEKRKFDLDKAVAVGGEHGLINGDVIKLVDFEVIEVRKNGNDFVVFKAKRLYNSLKEKAESSYKETHHEPEIFNTSSFNIVNRFKKINGVKDVEYKGVQLLFTSIKDPETERTYFDLQLA